MAYTVSTLAKLSGVSIRTLHYYDEIGLLKPDFVEETGYRYYGNDQLLILQQILFFKELGFGLKQIQEILQQKDFQRVKALRTQKSLLKDKVLRLQTLLKTIDTTINHLEEKQMVTASELFKGFEIESEQQKNYEKFVEEYLIQKYGKAKYQEMKKGYKDASSFTPDDMKKMRKESDEICKELVILMEKNLRPDSAEVQALIKKHHEMIMKFWTPTKETYAGHADFIMETDLRKFYDAYHPKLAQYIADAIKIFAQKHL